MFLLFHIPQERHNSDMAAVRNNQLWGIAVVDRDIPAAASAVRNHPDKRLHTADIEDSFPDIAMQDNKAAVVPDSDQTAWDIAGSFPGIVMRDNKAAVVPDFDQTAWDIAGLFPDIAKRNNKAAAVLDSEMLAPDIVTGD